MITGFGIVIGVRFGIVINDYGIVITDFRNVITA